MKGLLLGAALVLGSCVDGAWPLTGDVARQSEALERAASFERTIAAIEARRVELQRQYAAARDPEARAAVRAEARAYLWTAIDTELFPPWLGTPWGLGKNSTATRPHQAGMTVGCSYFVTSILQNAGFVLDDRYKFARAPALDIQRSLARGDDAISRYLSIPAEQLGGRIAELGDGLYLIGLSNHVAWVVVRGDDVRLVHASYTGGQQVSDEPLVGAQAIDVSRKAGYFVSPVVVADDRNDELIDAWLRGATITFRG
jgi:hypothetical protein